MGKNEIVFPFSILDLAVLHTDMWAIIEKFLLELALKLSPKLGKKLLANSVSKQSSQVIYHRNEVGNSKVICLLHGFSGNAETTFGKFPELILNDAEFNGWDVINIGYTSNLLPTIGLKLWAGQPDITKVANYMRSNLRYLLRSYHIITFVAHSMGGLVIQKAILDSSLDEQKGIDHVFLYGTPSNGLYKATVGSWYNNQISDMDRDGDFIKNLRSAWDQIFSGNLPFKLITVAGLEDEFVPTESSLDPFPEQYHAYAPGNHFSMVKPIDLSHPSFVILKSALIHHQNKPYLQIYNDKQLNQLVGDHAALVQSLEDRLEDLDERTFKEYIFALEGYKGFDQAIAVLENDQRVETNGDFMGILGGRYKRKYLATGSQSCLDKALRWYQKGFDLAGANDHLFQIHYHGINLAFLYLQGYDDRAKMKTFAEESLAAAKGDDRNDLWEAASMAEAFLYLQNIDQAKDYYKLAIEKAGSDKRAIDSMYLNAHHACAALGRNDWVGMVEDLFVSG